MTRHDLKIWPEYFRYTWSGEKAFELRYDDRAYRAGDILNLREWTRQEGYTGREIEVEVTYLLSGFGLKKDWVVMSFIILHKHDM